MTLNDSKPTIWRRIEIGSDTKLDKCALIILKAMGWENAYLHQFTCGAYALLYARSLRPGGFARRAQIHACTNFTERESEVFV
ncbi:MAG: hypothetical protein EAZ92_12985 [Candidatus Kapaibacterium sp.]|nr:MAG: hypothetical protein EAZ92_12985 [Candidatus Kapabacteria bacterium]